jgi:hypothetical protein
MHVFPKTEMRLILVDIDPFIYFRTYAIEWKKGQKIRCSAGECPPST